MSERRRPRKLLVFVLLLAAAGLAVFVAREALLRRVGTLLVVNDRLHTADIAVMTSETGRAGELELADLAAEHLTILVGVLMPEPTPADRELARRGVVTDNPMKILAALGVRPEGVVLIEAGEGGTTDGTEALARWCLARRVTRLIVVTSATHARRVLRSLSRQFGDAHVEVLMRTVRFDDFHASDWWHNRRTLREGLVEIQKLMLDYFQHPV